MSISKDTSVPVPVQDADSGLEKGVESTSTISPPNNSFTVTWSSPSDPSNPLNWSRKRKWFTTILTSFGGLVTLMSGSMLAPALPDIGVDLRVSPAEASLILSIYLLAFAFGPMILAPCSEVWGRRPVWVYGTAWYILWSTVCGFTDHKVVMIVGRLMSGLGASAEFAVSGSIVADCWSPDERGKSGAIRGFLPSLGPALGPILGGILVQKLNWRWIFWVISMLDGVVLILFVVALPETHEQTILSKKASALRKTTGDPYYTEYDRASQSLSHRLKLALVRPTRLLLTQPVIQIVAVILAYQFGLLYIVVSTFSALWTDGYGQSPAASGLHYLAVVIGFVIGTQAGGWATDYVWGKFKARNQGQTKPENRVPLMVPGAFLMPIGLLWYGWAAQQREHWVVVDLGIVVLGCGYISGVSAAQTYIVEAFLEYNASAGAATQFLRNVFAFAFPIFAPGLYDRLGYGYGNTILAAIATVLGLPGPYILWKFGERLRAKGGAQK